MKFHLGFVSFALLFGLSTMACGGGDSDSGVDKSKKANALSSSEVTTFCQWAIKEQGGAGHTTTCGGGLDFMVETQDECESNYTTLKPTCTVTVGDAESCVHALADAPCDFGGTDCQALVECSAELPRR